VVASEVPVAAAPEEGTANRAVLFAGLAGAGLVALLVAIVLRRRRRS
jgi:LPXTG-motif cell wall-anchored protein